MAAWVTNLIPVGRRNRPGETITPQYITVHDTGNTAVGAGAKAHGVFLKDNPESVSPGQVRSWHVTVDDKDIVQHLPFNEMAYHCGNLLGNEQSVSLEICENPESDRAKAENNAAKLTADLMKQYDIPIGNVVMHNFWTSTECPEKLKGHWNDFVRTVQRCSNGEIRPDWESLARSYKGKLDTIRKILEG